MGGMKGSAKDLRKLQLGVAALGSRVGSIGRVLGLVEQGPGSPADLLLCVWLNWRRANKHESV